MRLLIVFIFFHLTSCANHKKYSNLDYFDGGKFKNHDLGPKHGFFDFLKWRFTKDRTPWPSYVELPRRKNDIISRSTKPVITFINHATFLIQTDQLNILTDPIFSERTSPVTWAGPKRVIDPAISLEELPKIDLIIISHDHYDHLDLATLRYLKKRDNPLIFAGLEVGRVDRSLEITELKWWQEINTPDFQLTFTPCQHFSGRTLFDRNESLWGGFFFKSKSLSFYFAGDTGYSNHFKQVKKRFSNIDVAFLPIGAYKPRWFMKQMHINPEEAIIAHQDLKPKMSFGMHWGTFQLTDEGRMEPVAGIKQLSKQKNINNFKVLDFGEQFKFQH